MTYNGWVNFETWKVRLELFDGWDKRHLHSLTMSDDLDVYSVADQLEDYAQNRIEEDCTECLALSFARDFLSAVNWYDIAKRMVEDIKDENI